MTSTPKGGRPDLHREITGMSFRLSEETSLKMTEDEKAAFFRMLVDKFQREALEKYSLHISDSSVKLDQGYEEETQTLIYNLRYHPDSSKGVEFHGGPLDGTVQAIQPDKDGYAPPFWRIYHAPGRAEIARKSDALVPEIERDRIAEYIRDGIDKARDRWVYQFVGMS